MSDNIVVNIDFRGNGSEFLAELSRAVGRAKTQLNEMGQATSTLSRLETQLARLSTAANQNASAANRASAAVQGWSQKWTPFKNQFMEAEANSKGLWKSIDTGITSAEGSLGRATKAIQQFDESQRVAAQKRVGGNPMADWDKEFQALSRAADENAAKVKRAQQAIQDYQNSLSNSRYVLYDVAGTLGIMGAGLIAPLVAAVGVAANFEREFAQVARTSGLAGSALRDLKGEFDALYGSLPLSYEALADIATLAGQLGVPAQDIAQFTKVVAQTSAVTDLSVEQAATAFGRLNALIPNVKGQYDRLGSAIALVGVNSVATESEIVNISTQISSMGSFAGLTAQDIVGLSGALASIGAQPELSRGTVTRVFTLMSKAVAEGGSSLDEFARVSGVSSQQFASTWGTPAFTQTFLGFMNGIKNEGGSAVQTLNDLGITSVRDVPLLLRLANAADQAGNAGGLLAQTISDSNKGWNENNELQRQYEIIASTVSARLEVLSNNFNLLLQAIGGPALSGLADFLSLLTDITQGATDFAQTDLGGQVLRVVVGLSAALGVLSLVGAGFAVFGASTIGVYQGLQFIAAASPRAAAGLVGTAGAAALADGSMKAGAASAALMGRALAALSLIGLAFVLPDALNTAGQKLADFSDQIFGVTRDFESALDRLSVKQEAFFGLSGFDIKQNPISSFFLSVPWDQNTRDLQAINDELIRLANAGDFNSVASGLERISKASGYSLSEILPSNSDLAKRLQEAGVELQQFSDGTIKVKGGAEAAAGATAQMQTPLETLQAEAEAAKGSLEEFKDALDAINGTVLNAAAASDALQSSINKAGEAIKAEGVSLDGTNDSSIAFREGLRDMEEKARAAATAVAENGGSTEEAAGKWNLGRDAQIALLESLGLSREEAIKWADTNLGKSEEVVRAIDGVRAAQDRVRNTPVIINIEARTAAAQAAFDEYLRRNSGKVITVQTAIGSAQLNTSSDSLVVKRAATGGSIWGPGTGTSDSILARLSNGEFVVRAQAASAIGHGRLDYMNRTGKLPAFATGGSVGAPSGGSFGGSMMVELSPTDRMLLARAGDVSLSIDGREIATATNSANLVSARRGSN